MSLVAGIADAARGPVWSTPVIVSARLRSFHVPVAPASAAWPQANLAILIPFLVSTPVTFAEIFFTAGTLPGTTTYDLGIYRDDFTRIISLGSTAAVSTTDAILPVGGGALSTPTTLSRGRYYLAMSSAAITLTCRAAVNGNGMVRALGMQQMAVAHPLPATITPATMGFNYIPTVGLTTVTNIL